MIKINQKPVQAISIVGAGPGAPELLTLRAMHVIQKADIILYDDLVGSEIIDLLSATVKKIYVGKRYQDNINQNERLTRINDYYIKYYKEGKKVVRLKGGDPMVFSRATEEMLFLLNNKIPFEVVPGLTSALAGASLNAMPVTVRNDVRSLVILTASTAEGEFDLVKQIQKFLLLKSNIMIYMGGNQLDFVIEKLNKSNSFKKTEMVVISNISGKKQKIFSGTVQSIKSKLDTQIEMPVIIYLGKELRSYLVK